MKQLKLAYRDDDRTPVIFCIKEIATRHYDLEVEVIQIKDKGEYEGALFNGSCDVIIEHLDYLYAEAAQGRKVTMFCAPSKGAGLELVVPNHINGIEELKGKTMAVISRGRPHSVTLWLRMMGLEKEVKILIVDGDEVGRWGQWKKVVTGDCIATFISPLYLPQALAAGLKILPVPDIVDIGHFAQACLSQFAKENSDLLRDYVKAVIHALCLITFRKEQALEIVLQEPMKRMNIKDVKEMESQFDCIAKELKTKPYPTSQAIVNTYECTTVEYPGAKGLNPMTLWDLHWVKELDDGGFIDDLIKQMRGSDNL